MKKILFLLLLAGPAFGQTYIGIGGSPVSPAIQGSVYIPLLSKSHFTITAGHHWQDTTKHDPGLLLENYIPEESQRGPHQTNELPAVFALVGMQTLLSDGIFVGGAVGARYFRYKEAEYMFEQHGEPNGWKYSDKTKTAFDYSVSVGYLAKDWGIKGEYNPNRLFAAEILFALP